MCKSLSLIGGAASWLQTHTFIKSGSCRSLMFPDTDWPMGAFHYTSIHYKSNFYFDTFTNSHGTTRVIENCILRTRNSPWTKKESVKRPNAHSVSGWHRASRLKRTCVDLVNDSDTELLELLQVVVEGLDVRKHTHGVWLVPHLQHVVHLNQPQTVGLLPET